MKASAEHQDIAAAREGPCSCRADAGWTSYSVRMPNLFAICIPVIRAVKAMLDVTRTLGKGYKVATHVLKYSTASLILVLYSIYQQFCRRRELRMA